MKKKFYSLLVLPLVAIMCLFGCGKVDRTVKEIETLWADTVAMFESPAVDGGTNWYFATTDSHQVFNVQYDNDSQILLNTTINNLTNPSTNLEKRYYQLKSVYARTLTMAFNYYSNWSTIFYGGIEAKDVDAEDLTELYDRMKAFQRELSSFHIAKENLEREIRLFGLSSEIIGSSVDSFNNNYNNLVDKTLSFVNYFRDLHVEYFYGSNPTIDSSYAKRLYDDALLELANYIYYDYLDAIEKNSTVKLVEMYDGDDDNADNDINNIFNHSSSKLDSICTVGSQRTNQLSANFADVLLDTTNPKYNTAKSQVEKFEVSLNTFKQHFSLYKKVYSKIDMESFNNYRFAINGGYADQETYLASLSVVDAANVRVLISFEENNIYSFMNAIYEYWNTASAYPATNA